MKMLLLWSLLKVYNVFQAVACEHALCSSQSSFLFIFNFSYKPRACSQAIQATYLEKKIVCSLCYNVIHKEKCSPEVLLQYTCMTRKMHGNETRETIKLYMAEKFKKVKVYAISVRKSRMIYSGRDGQNNHQKTRGLDSEPIQAIGIAVLNCLGQNSFALLFSRRILP